MNGFQFRLAISSATAAAAASACCSPASSNRSPKRQRSTQCCNRGQHSMSTDIESRMMLHFKEPPQHQHPRVPAPERDARCVGTLQRQGALRLSGGYWLGDESIKGVKRLHWLALTCRRTMSDSLLTAIVSRKIKCI